MIFPEAFVLFFSINKVQFGHIAKGLGEPSYSLLGTSVAFSFCGHALFNIGFYVYAFLCAFCSRRCTYMLKLKFDAR